MVVGTLRVEIYINGNRSLKGKRQVVRKVIDRVKSRFNVSIAEVDGQDLWQRAVLGISFVSNESSFVNSTLNQVARFIEAMGTLYYVGKRDIDILHL